MSFLGCHLAFSSLLTFSSRSLSLFLTSVHSLYTLYPFLFNIDALLFARMTIQVSLLIAIICGILFASLPKSHASILCSLQLRSANKSSHTTIQSRPIYRTELVVAWCTEKIEWVMSAVKEFDHVIVYSKCGVALPPQLLDEKNVNMETLPNVGVCDNTYLHHIVTYWESLALWTVFYKGSEEIDCPASTMIFHNMEIYPHLFCCEKNFGIVRQKYQFIPSFKLTGYRPARNQVRFPYIFTNQTMGQWAASTFGFANADRLFSYGPSFCRGGYFAAPLHAIHRHPIIVYEAMKIQQVHTLEEIDHFVERTWDALLRMPRMECMTDDTDVRIDSVASRRMSQLHNRTHF